VTRIHVSPLDWDGTGSPSVGARCPAVRDKLRAHKLYAKRSKCQFAETTVDYLGYVISAHGFSMEAEKVNAIRTWTTPQSKKDVQSFLGMVNFYRRFIINMAEVAVPLTRLTGNVDFESTANAEASF